MVENCCPNSSRMSSKLQPIFVISNTQKGKNTWKIFFLLSISNKTMLCWFGTKTSLFEIGYCFTLRRAKRSCFMPFQVGNNFKKEAAAASDGMIRSFPIRLLSYHQSMRACFSGIKIFSKIPSDIQRSDFSTRF